MVPEGPCVIGTYRRGKPEFLTVDPSKPIHPGTYVSTGPRENAMVFRITSHVGNQYIIAGPEGDLKVTFNGANLEVPIVFREYHWPWAIETAEGEKYKIKLVNDDLCWTGHPHDGLFPPVECRPSEGLESQMWFFTPVEF
ncbi:hypothetical protein RhiJN_25112 [Ceratobasidium sp. AG-Ba]|nr:hypothetical protein RhiJN_25112 [Ceratobasidium sp. AG-Ba]